MTVFVMQAMLLRQEAAYGLPMQPMVVVVRVCLFSMAEFQSGVSHRVKLSLPPDNGQLQ